MRTKTSLELREAARAVTSKALVLLALVPWTWNSLVDGMGSELLAREVPPCRCGGDRAGGDGQERVEGHRESRERKVCRIAPCLQPLSFTTARLSFPSLALLLPPHTPLLRNIWWCPTALRIKSSPQQGLGSPHMMRMLAVSPTHSVPDLGYRVSPLPLPQALLGPRQCKPSFDPC